MKLYVAGELNASSDVNNSHRTRYQTSGNLIFISSAFDCTPQKYLGALRGCVTEFSPCSRAGMRHYLRSCDAVYSNMVTLTYPSEWPSDGKLVKSNLANFLKRCARFWKSTGYGGTSPSVFWFLEFQKRGAPHFHLFTTHFIPHTEVSRWWYEIVGSGDERHLRAGTRCEKLRGGKAGLCSYAAKYAAKGDQKLVPVGYEEVGRFWGVHGARTTSTAAFTFSANEARLPKVEFEITELKRQIKLALETKKAKMLVKKDGFRMICVTDVYVMVMLSKMINRISATLDDYRLDVSRGTSLTWDIGDDYAACMQNETKQNEEKVLHGVRCDEGGTECDRRFNSQWPPLEPGKVDGMYGQTTWLPVDSDGTDERLTRLVARKFSKEQLKGSDARDCGPGQRGGPHPKEITAQIAWPGPSDSYLPCTREDYISARDGG